MTGTVATFNFHLCFDNSKVPATGLLEINDLILIDFVLVLGELKSLATLRTPLNTLATLDSKPRVLRYARDLNRHPRQKTLLYPLG